MLLPEVSVCMYVCTSIYIFESTCLFVVVYDLSVCIYALDWQKQEVRMHMKSQTHRNEIEIERRTEIALLACLNVQILPD